MQTKDGREITLLGGIFHVYTESLTYTDIDKAASLFHYSWWTSNYQLMDALLLMKDVDAVFFFLFFFYLQI